MTPRRALPWVALAAALAASSCSTRKSADELGTARSDAAPLNLPDTAVPLDLREFEVVSSEGGYRGVFLKLTRLPTEVTHASANDPARIEITVMGPTGTQSPEEVFPGGDTLVTRMRVSRDVGMLRIVLDLQGDSVPEYTVLPMADWIMVRLKTESKGRPWAHRAS